MPLTTNPQRDPNATELPRSGVSHSHPGGRHHAPAGLGDQADDETCHRYGDLGDEAGQP